MDEKQAISPHSIVEWSRLWQISSGRLGRVSFDGQRNDFWSRGHRRPSSRPGRSESPSQHRDGWQCIASQAEGSAVQYKYWAFISYSHTDKSWAHWLGQRLETYRLPRSLVGKPSRDGIVPRRLFPVFRDREELATSGDLGASLKKALDSSRYLIVICSPSAAKSRWVNEEIRYFKRSQAEERVLCFIVAGEPNAADKPNHREEECFPEAMRFRIGVDGTLTDVRTEPMAADARKEGDGKMNAKLKTIAGLAGVNFDDLKHRDQRRRFRQRLCLGSLIVMLTMSFLAFALFEETRMKNQRTTEHIQKYVEHGENKLKDGKLLQATAYFGAAYNEHRADISTLSKSLQQRRISGLIESSKALAKELLVLSGHKYWVSSAAFGRKLVTASWDRTIQLWNLNIGDPEAGNPKVVARAKAKVLSVNLSPDETRILGGCWDGYAYIWDFDGHLVATLKGHTGRVNYAAFSPNGQQIVTASDDYTARAWLTNGDPLFTMEGHTDSVKSAVYSPDGGTILTAGFDGTARIWDSSSGRFLLAIDVSTEGQKELNFAAFSPDGKRIATVGLGPAVIIWNLKEMEGRREVRRIGRINCTRGRINYVQFNHSGTLLVTASDEDNVKIWDIRDITHIQLWMSLERHKGRTLCAVFSPDDDRLVTTGDDTFARLWDIRPREQNLLELVTTIQKESPWEIRDGQLSDRLGNLAQAQ